MFRESVVLCLRQYGRFRGRASRAEFWGWVVSVAVVWLVLMLAWEYLRDCDGVAEWAIQEWSGCGDPSGQRPPGGLAAGPRHDHPDPGRHVSETARHGPEGLVYRPFGTVCPCRCGCSGDSWQPGQLFRGWWVMTLPPFRSLPQGFSLWWQP